MIETIALICTATFAACVVTGWACADAGFRQGHAAGYEQRRQDEIAESIEATVQPRPLTLAPPRTRPFDFETDGDVDPFVMSADELDALLRRQFPRLRLDGDVLRGDDDELVKFTKSRLGLVAP